MCHPDRSVTKWRDLLFRFRFSHAFFTHRAGLVENKHQENRQRSEESHAAALGPRQFRFGPSPSVPEFPSLTVVTAYSPHDGYGLAER